MRTLTILLMGSLAFGCGTAGEPVLVSGQDSGADGRPDGAEDAAQGSTTPDAGADERSLADRGSLEASDDADGASEEGAGAVTDADASLTADTTDAAANDAPDSAESEAATCTNWSYWNEGLSGGNITVVRFDPRTSGVVYAGAGEHFYRSANAGQSWTLATTNAVGAISEIGFPSGSPDQILAATSDGLRGSDDGGKTWSARALQGVSLTTLLVDRSSPRIFIGGDQGLLMRSTDGGTTWRSTSSGVPFGQVTGLLGDPTNPDTAVASVILEDDSGAIKNEGVVVRSTNGGISWKTVLHFAGIAWRLSQCAADPKVMYASTGVGISKSPDGGATWGPFSLSDKVALDVGVDATQCDRIYASVFPGGIARSIDGGTTWSPPVTNGMVLQPGYEYAASLAVDPTDGASVLSATHDGVFRSSNGGDLWSATPGLRSVSCRDLGVSPTAPQQLWMASWGSGAWRRPSPGAAWERVPLSKLPLDWLTTVYPDSRVAGRLLVGSGNAWRSTDDAQSFVATNGQGNPFVFATDPTNSAVVYMGTQVTGVYKSLDGGATWQASNTGATDAFVLSILIDSTDGRTIYIGTQDRGILRSTDAGASWGPTTMGLGAGQVATMVRFGNAVYAWVDGGGVFRSEDGMAWAASNTGLEALSSGGLVVDGAGSRLIAVAGPRVYTSSDGTRWSPFDKGCQPPTGGSKPTIVSDGAKRFLVFGAGASGVLAHSL